MLFSKKLVNVDLDGRNEIDILNPGPKFGLL